MLPDDIRVSLADLSAAGVRLRPGDAVTIVRELLRQVVRGDIPGVPSAHVIRLLPSGLVTVEGPVASDRAVSRAAQLLESLLPPFDAARELRVPGALRLIVARALGALDVTPYGSLESFSEALQRFADADPPLTIRRLVDSWVPAPADASDARTSGVAHEDRESPRDRGPAPWPSPLARLESHNERAAAVALVLRDPRSLTISDIRRARRASGLPLPDISQRTGVPVDLLRQLEWGYLRHWPPDASGRALLAKYARAAGLDEQLVLSVVWPMIEHVAVEPRPEIAVEAVEVTPIEAAPALAGLQDLPLYVEAPPAPAPRMRRGIAGVGALLATAATIAFLLLPRASEFMPSRTSGTVTQETPAPAVPQTAAPVSRQEATTPAARERDVDPAARADSGSNPRIERARGLPDDEAAWSPAFAMVGSAMFYHEGDPGTRTALVRANTGTDGAILRITRVVDDHARNFHARPSPDGTRIAFDSDRDGERGVYVANADGSNVRRVTGDGFAAVPSWSPDGTTLAFVRAEPDRPRVWNLWTLDLASGEMRRLTSHRYGQPWGGSWFPDGQRLAYSHEDRLVVLDTMNGRERVYPSPREGRLLRTPAVSPDGRRIMFQVYRDGAWLLELADGSKRKVLADPTAEEYTWSPDGRRVAYHSRQSGHWAVWLMAPRH
jgi:Tol biopolymer transport system component